MTTEGTPPEGERQPAPGERQPPPGTQSPLAGPPVGTPWCAVIVNPAKAGDGLPDVERLIAAETEQVGWAPPKLWETTPEDPGVGQAREAVESRPALVVAAGGDGTTRAVAGVLAGTGIPLGLLPMGTGNLLARNLEIPLNDGAAAVDIVVNGGTRPVDVCRLEVRRADGTRSSEASVVMLGMGFDAEVVGDAPDELKRRLGWGAYVATGLRKLWGRSHPVRIWVDDRPPAVRNVRSVLVATAGTLTGGVTLLPQARLDDGVCDVVTFAPRGIIGWPSIILWAVTGARGGHAMVRHAQARTVRIDTRWPLPAQVDGDAIGDAIRFDVTVEQGALLVRTPATASP